jgi:hypothetical protein
MISQRAELTFKGNLRQGRHGWLRLTPAYSVQVVRKILDGLDHPDRVLDLFSATGTTGLVCAERGLTCDLIEINLFLAWLAQAKTHDCTAGDLSEAWELAQATAAQVDQSVQEDLWIPPIHHIEHWGTLERLTTLASLFHNLRLRHSSPALDLVRIAFCRVAIEWSNAAFNHQSMSFKDERPTLFGAHEQDLIVDAFLANVRQIIASARQQLPGRASVHRGDSRRVSDVVTGPYDCVITSPPYPNRISYIRELRPYMYWLGHINEAREAGDLDWEAIGGTWGVATSRLAQWTPNGATIQHEGFDDLVQEIAKRSPVLANYVHKYFVDIAAHLTSLSRVLAPGAKVFYIVGNSKFYETVVPVEKIYESLLVQCGFKNARSELLRKRNSKKELYEFVVSGEWGGQP